MKQLGTRKCRDLYGHVPESVLKSVPGGPVTCEIGSLRPHSVAVWAACCNVLLAFSSLSWATLKGCMFNWRLLCKRQYVFIWQTCVILKCRRKRRLTLLIIAWFLYALWFLPKKGVLNSHFYTLIRQSTPKHIFGSWCLLTLLQGNQVIVRKWQPRPINGCILPPGSILSFYQENGLEAFGMILFSSCQVMSSKNLCRWARRRIWFKAHRTVKQMLLRVLKNVIDPADCVFSPCRAVLVSAISPTACSRRPKAASPAIAAPLTGQTEERFPTPSSQKAVCACARVCKPKTTTKKEDPVCWQWHWAFSPCPTSLHLHKSSLSLLGSLFPPLSKLVVHVRYLCMYLYKYIYILYM